MHIPAPVLSILNALESAGFEAFIVGGCVRDLLRGTAPKDWDIATAATPQEVKGLFRRTVDTGLAHGTVTVLMDGAPYEVTTYRIDGPYPDARRPASVAYTTQIAEDLSRRDFTMNAIAYNPAKGFADPFDGQADIAKGIIRCVGDAAHRFGEDALRMLRAVRFAGTLGFAVDDETLAAISAQKENLARISAERVREELTRLICGDFPQALKMLETTGLMPYVLQGNAYPDDINKIIGWLEMLLQLKNKNSYLSLTLFFSSFNESALPALLRSLRFDNKTIRAVSLYARLLPVPIPADRYAIKKHLRLMPEASAQVFFENLLTLQSIARGTAVNELRRICREIHQSRECYTLKTLAVTGADLAAAGIPPGKKMGEALEQLLDAVIREPALNDRAMLSKMAADMV